MREVQPHLFVALLCNISYLHLMLAVRALDGIPDENDQSSVRKLKTTKNKPTDKK